MLNNNLNKTYTLPCGAVLKNRLVKAAMTERISNRKLHPVKGHEILYDKWSETKAGLLITGNVIIDKNHPESAGNVYLQDETLLPKLKRWADAAKKHGNHIWVQISHAGRQTNKYNNRKPLAPSPVQLKKMGMFAKPRAMTEQDIQHVIAGFIRTAEITQKAGFTGVQIHSAHGYLLSQFLSPYTNKRSDEWGGTLENRSRILIEIIRGIRQKVGAQFPVSVKLNSSDFQKGGFTEDESLELIQMLEKEKIDLLEISGGTYEKVAFFEGKEEQNIRESTRKREAYFIEFAEKVRKISQIPLMITGGFRSYDFCNEMLQKGSLDLIGMARPFITDLHKIQPFLNGEVDKLNSFSVRTKFKGLNDAAEAGYYAKQIIRFSKNKDKQRKIRPFFNAIFLILYEFRKSIIKKLPK
jgi:2,4-dienoyl-CoA reductase-like NADH-dependent reductase (Old Yellow Enzyme family)